MLRQFRGKFLLKSESLLEEFIWLNLNELLKINPLKRQYFVNNKNRTDILGITQERSLAIIELKKKGGKGSINQLITYRENVLKYSSQYSILSEVNFEQDFVLIAIAGHFSPQAQKYANSKLPEALLLTYEIQKSQNNEYSLILRNHNNKIYSRVKIDIIEDSLFDSLPSLLQGYLIDNPQHRIPIISIIKQMISFSSDIKFETSSYYDSNGDLQKNLLFAKYNQKNEILNNKICTEFHYYYSPADKITRLYLSVYLPTIDLNIRNSKRHKLIDGVTIDSDDFIHVNELRDGNTVMSRLGKIPLRYPLKTTEIDETYSSFEDYYINYRKYMKSRQSLRSINRSDFTLVEKVVKMTLEDWSVR
ncbi:MAG: type I restriction enzyme HsdR N-terminal domain-containing protein [Xenococcaceae cyanobacterium MO_188.B29]|nr:type I restriction enzyme HsdR N-terminal domain-containing protein [Xenococcaceae cyanobacterium MO_188.B29]